MHFAHQQVQIGGGKPLAGRFVGGGQGRFNVALRPQRPGFGEVKLAGRIIEGQGLVDVAQGGFYLARIEPESGPPGIQRGIAGLAQDGTMGYGPLQGEESRKSYGEIAAVEVLR